MNMARHGACNLKFNIMIDQEITKTDDILRLLNILKDQGAITLKLVAAELGLSSGSASRIARLALAEGFLKCVDVSIPSDLRRRKRYSLTEKGLRYRLANLKSYVDRRTREYVLLGEELSNLRREFEVDVRSSTAWRRSRSKSKNSNLSNGI